MLQKNFFFITNLSPGNYGGEISNLGHRISRNPIKCGLLTGRKKSREENLQITESGNETQYTLVSTKIAYIRNKGINVNSVYGILVTRNNHIREQSVIWGLFLKSPETFRAYFGSHNSFTFSQGRGFKPSNLAIL